MCNFQIKLNLELYYLMLVSLIRKCLPAWCALYAQYSEVMPSPTLLDTVIAWIPSVNLSYCLWYLRNYTSVHLLSAGLVSWIWRCHCWWFSAMIYSLIPCLCIVWTKFIYVPPYYGIEHWNVSNRGKYTYSYCGGKLLAIK